MCRRGWRERALARSGSTSPASSWPPPAAMQAQFGVDFPLVLANAERVPFQDHSFGLAISEYGASLWCDPHRWIPEAARLLWPGGRLVFLRPSPLFALCVPVEGQVSRTLLRPQFGLCRLDWGRSAEFNLLHGEMLRLLRFHGFMVEDLIDPGTAGGPSGLSPGLGRLGPQLASEEIWKTRLAG